MTTTFTGWPAPALPLLAEIAADNRTERWPQWRERHERDVRGPMRALAAELADEFGPVRVFRPHVDRRFRPDVPPLRTDIGCLARSPGGASLTVVLSAAGLAVTAGVWRLDAAGARAYRSAVADEAGALPALLEGLAVAGLAADAGDPLRGAPRGLRADHPRIALLRRRGLQVGRTWEPGPWLGTPEPLARVREAWRAAAPLLRWLETHATVAEAA